jgi:hypothetical protein
MGPGWAALTALSFIMGAIPGAPLRFAPGYHRTALSALKARQPASQSSKIRTFRVLFAKFASCLPAFPLFAFSRILALQPSAFSLQPSAFSLTLDVTVTLKMTGMVAGTFYLSKSCVKIADI